MTANIRVDDVITGNGGVRSRPGHVIVRSANGLDVTATAIGSNGVVFKRPVTAGTENIGTYGRTRSPATNGKDLTARRSTMGSDGRRKSTDRPDLELFVRAGKDSQRLGGCPLCHRVHLALAVKLAASEAVSTSPVTAVDSDPNDELSPRPSSRSSPPPPSMPSFTVTPVNMARPPHDFRLLQPSTRRLPVLVHRRRRQTSNNDNDDNDGDDDKVSSSPEVVTDPDEIVQYVDSLFPFPPMSYDTSGEAAVACRDVFSRFSYFVKDVSGSAAPLLSELRRVDAYLSTSNFRYLNNDDRLDHLDCIVLPKLQHIRVAARAIKEFEIPAELTGLWRYLAAAYADPVFRRTCPTDQEIVHHWHSKPECHRLPKSKLALYSPEGPPRFSVDVPAGII